MKQELSTIQDAVADRADGPAQNIVEIAQKHPRITPTQVRFTVLWLLDGMSQRDAADEVGTRRATVYKWLQRPVFLAWLKDFRDVLLEAASLRAITTLMHLMESSTSDRVRMAAAESVLDRVGSVSAAVPQASTTRILIQS